MEFYALSKRVNKVILVDDMERRRNLQRVLEPKNLERTRDKLVAMVGRCDSDLDILNEHMDKQKCSELTVHINQYEDWRTQLVETYNLVDGLINKTRVYSPPNYLDMYGVKETKLNPLISQADFKIEREDRTMVYVELKSSFLTLRDAIYNPQKILTSKKLVEDQGDDYRLLVVLPPEERMETWIQRTRIHRRKFARFFNMSRELNMRKLRLPHPVYAQPVQNYFLNLPKNEALFKEKQERIFERIKNL